MKNYGMMEYNFVENTKFEGVMPKAAEIIGTIGASDIIVEMFGANAKGSDALEIIDIEKPFGDESSNEEDETEQSYPDFINDDNIVLGTNFEPSETIIISEGNKTLDLNNNSITAPVFVDESDNSTNSYGILVKGGEITIDGEGEIIAQDSDYSMSIWANGGNVTIKNGTFRNSGNNCDLIYASNGGNVKIYGGNFIANGTDGNAEGTKNPYSALNIKDRDRNNSSIEVFGGRFYKFNPSDNLSEGEHTNFVASGYKSVQDGDWWEVMPE